MKETNESDINNRTLYGGSICLSPNLRKTERAKRGKKFNYHNFDLSVIVSKENANKEHKNLNLMLIKSQNMPEVFTHRNSQIQGLSVREDSKKEKTKDDDLSSIRKASLTLNTFKQPRYSSYTNNENGGPKQSMRISMLN